jgi:hypothetical protein
VGLCFVLRTCRRLTYTHTHNMKVTIYVPPEHSATVSEAKRIAGTKRQSISQICTKAMAAYVAREKAKK